MLITDLRTSIISCNGKSWKLSPGQHQMLKWMYYDEVPVQERDAYFLWYIQGGSYESRGNYLNYLSELVYKGMEGEV